MEDNQHGACDWERHKGDGSVSCRGSLVELHLHGHRLNDPFLCRVSSDANVSGPLPVLIDLCRICLVLSPAADTTNTDVNGSSTFVSDFPFML